MTVRMASTIQRWIGVAADTKPSSGVRAGSTFYVIDTGLMYVYDGSDWQVYSHTTLGDDDFAIFGGVAKLGWETADANANALVLALPEGGATDVPVFVIGDASILNADLGWFNGVTEPRVAVVDDDKDSYVALGFTADDAAAIILGGSAALTLPALTLGGAVAGGGQNITNLGDLTFASGKGITSIGDIVFQTGKGILSGPTNGNTAILAANDTTFITLTTGATDVCELNNVTMKGTWLASGTVTVPALTLGGAISGNAQTISNANVTVGASRTLDVSAGTLTLADNQISGDKVEGGTIAAITITALTAADITASGTVTCNGDLIAGTLDIDDDSGAVTLVDIGVTDAPVAGTEESYAFKIDGTTIAKVYAEADHAGGIQNPAFVIGTGIPIKGHKWVVENHTADDALTLAESGSIHTNYGEDGAMTLTLPASATAGTTFKFVVATAQELRVEVSAAAEVFLVNGGTSTDDGGGDLYLVADDEGETATFTCIAAGVWLVDVIGTWTPTQP